ncbi:DNA-binding protein [Enterobacter hormaechei]|nr:DNA-binding protein [Enterobacter hormaechei]ELC6615604.1 excisionase family protein [Enterobacter hormaechei]ELZ3623131.1 excisionase family protein [Enterobacter hormaechei]
MTVTHNGKQYTAKKLNDNEWQLTSATGMSKHMIQHARRSTWMEGKHYRHVAPDMAPKQNSPIMYNRDEINHWIEHQSPAKRRRISA